MAPRRLLPLLALAVLACCTPSAVSSARDEATGSPPGQVTLESADAGVTSAVRFVALGDTGKGNDGQRQVGRAMASLCARRGCDFAVLLGDNIYESGVSGPSDPQFQEKFEKPYAGLDIPFYVVLGNHDYGGHGAGNEFDKGAYEVQYTERSRRWKMPAPYYRVTVGNVELIALDTNMQLFDRASQQEADVRAWLSEEGSDTWRVVLGHHPYRSNGYHGNAGEYDGKPGNGIQVKRFVEGVVCGKADLYLSAHDHQRQWFKDSCQGTELLVSGAGAYPRALRGRNPVHFQSDRLGFLYVVVEGDTLTAEFVNERGETDFKRKLTSSRLQP